MDPLHVEAEVHRVLIDSLKEQGILALIHSFGGYSWRFLLRDGKLYEWDTVLRNRLRMTSLEYILIQTNSMTYDPSDTNPTHRFPFPLPVHQLLVDILQCGDRTPETPFYLDLTMAIWIVTGVEQQSSNTTYRAWFNGHQTVTFSAMFTLTFNRHGRFRIRDLGLWIHKAEPKIYPKFYVVSAIPIKRDSAPLSLPEEATKKPLLHCPWSEQEIQAVLNKEKFTK